LFSTDPFLRIVSEYVGHTNTQNKRVQLALLINCKIFPAAKSVLCITPWALLCFQSHSVDIWDSESWRTDSFPFLCLEFVSLLVSLRFALSWCTRDLASHLSGLTWHPGHPGEPNILDLKLKDGHLKILAKEQVRGWGLRSSWKL
jgi:hypothetical protein